MKHIAVRGFHALMILSMFFWGASWISAKNIAEVPASVAAFWRFLLMFASFVPCIFFQRTPWKLHKKELVFTILAAASLTFYNILFFWGLYAGYAGKHGVLTTTMNPLFTFLWAAFFRMRHGDWIAWLGLGIGFLGGAVQMVGDSLSLAGFLDPTGLFFVLSAAVYALLTVFGQKAQHSYSLFQFSFMLYGLATLFILPLAAFHGAFELPRWNAGFWLNIVFISLFVGTFATTMYFFAAKHLGAAKAASFTFTIPVTVVILSLVFLGELPQITSLLGGAMSLIAVVMIQRVPKNSQMDPPG